MNTTPVLALVPARGGSKGIAKKNLALVGGKPLVLYTLEAAKRTGVVDAVWLSSDDEEILDLGRSAGVNTLKRPSEYANDQASAVVVVQHFLDSLGSSELDLNPVILYLQPTSPLRNALHIAQALELMGQEKTASVISVVAQRHSPYKSFRLNSSGRLQSLFDERMSNARRQDLPCTYIPNGAIYGFRAKDFLAHSGFPSNGAVPYIMSEIDSVDVDTVDDLIRAERIMENARA